MPVDLQRFINNSDWVYADEHGSPDFFYQKQMIYLEYDGHVYWHMENIINRCLPEETYSRRKAENRLP